MESILKRIYLLSFLLSSFLVNATESKLPTFSKHIQLSANIKRTSYGVPHIKADSLEGIAFGSGYAQAQDQLCQLAESFIKSNSELSMYLGPHSKGLLESQSMDKGDSAHLISDFGYLALGIKRKAKKNFAELSDQSKALLLGYSKGYNKFLSQANLGEVKASRLCWGEAWVKPISPEGVLTNLYALNLIRGSSNFFEMMFVASPNGSYMPRLVTNQSDNHADVAQVAANNLSETGLPDIKSLGFGSNGWALGSQLTETGRGMLLSNPHFPLYGPLRFWQSHITIPGKLNAAGVSLLGFPGILNIGFNKDLAWTHTLSESEQFVVYRLDLDGKLNTKYRYNGGSKSIFKRTLALPVNVNGELVKYEKDYWFSHFGPIVASPDKNSPFAWGGKHTFSIKDVYTTNDDMIDHWLAMNSAASLGEVKEAFARYRGITFVNTIVTDKQGQAFYIDGTNVPALTPEAIAALSGSNELKAIREKLGFTVLPGNSSEFNFTGALGFDDLPQLQRTDFVQNSNDSYWSTNPASPLEGFSPLFGPERVELSLRTRMGLKLLNEAKGEDGVFSLKEVETLLFSDRAYLVELLVPQLQTLCKQDKMKVIQINDRELRVGDACAAVSQWRVEQGSSAKGGVLLRELANLFDSDEHFSVPFDYKNPADTPSGIKSDVVILKLLARAQLILDVADIPLASSIDELQFVVKPGIKREEIERISWPGSTNAEGGFNVNSVSDNDDFNTQFVPNFANRLSDAISGEALDSGLSAAGYQLGYGASWMMLVEYGKRGPVARGLLSYSQSMDPDSAHYKDQTLYFSQNRSLRPILFEPKEIEENKVSEIKISNIVN